MNMIRSIGLIFLQMLRVYGVRGKLLKAVKSFYVDSRSVSEWEMMLVSGFRLMLD